MPENLVGWPPKKSLLRVFDFSLPQGGDEALWNGYARRSINGYVPRFSPDDVLDTGKYKSLDETIEPEAIKTLNHLACEDDGVNALMTIKGDIDNLGLIFERGLVRSDTQEGLTFAKMSALSRQVNAFFTIYLPYQCLQKYPNTYTVFAGGDDFFLIGPWSSQLRLSRDMQQWFKEYVAHNPDVHFSAGLSMTKPGLPIRYLAEQSEQALKKAKGYNSQAGNPSLKNAVTCYGYSVGWADFIELLDMANELDGIRDRDEIRLSAGYLYGLIKFADMQAAISQKPENALWHSWFAYRTRRMLERIRRLNDGQRQQLQTQLADAIAHRGIEKYAAVYKIALFTYLYKNREEDQCHE